MQYRSVGNRCAVDIRSLRLPIPNEVAWQIVLGLGCQPVQDDPVRLAEQCVGRSAYRRGARPCQAPDIVDCSSLVKWIYGQIGIWLPRRTIQQIEFGSDVDPLDMRPGDIIFKTGWKNWFNDNPEDGVGHVGIVTNGGLVVHAASRKSGVIRSPVGLFMRQDVFRGIRRIIPANTQLRTLLIPTHLDVESDDDLRWLILQRL